MRLILLMAAASTLAASGCTHHQLRRSAVGQVGSVADIYQQQVLNNLARFARDPNSLPDFGVPTSGLSTVSDTGNVSNGLGWNASSLTSAMLGFQGTRNINQNWSLTPVQDPRKLELMRCAYRNAVGKMDCSLCCPDCTKRFAKFYTGDPCGVIPDPCKECPCLGLTGEGKADCVAANAAAKKDTGIVTSKCLGSCWFHVGCSDCFDEIRRKNPCCLIGEHCGTVVWVTPGKGTDELSKLTIAILDYAVNDPKKLPVKGTKEVIGYFDGDGNSVSQGGAHFTITATLPATKPEGDFNETERLDSAIGLQKLLLGKPATADDILVAPTPTTDPGPKERTMSPAEVQIELLEKGFQLR